VVVLKERFALEDEVRQRLRDLDGWGIKNGMVVKKSARSWGRVLRHYNFEMRR
jgi:hypothetical protein